MAGSTCVRSKLGGEGRQDAQDLLRAGSESDRFVGGAGADTLRGVGGADRCTGGPCTEANKGC